MSENEGRAMSRYIDAEKELTELKAMKVEGETFTTAVNFAIIILEQAPSIDIVRCKECKWAKANGTYQWCGRLDSTARITADDFCSYGEREGE